MIQDQCQKLVSPEQFYDVVTIVSTGFSFSSYFLLFVTLGPTSHDHKVMYTAVGHSQ